MKTKLRELRERKQMTQAELAKKCGLSMQTISCIECGTRKTIFMGTLHKLAHGLEVTVNEIIVKGVEECADGPR